MDPLRLSVVMANYNHGQYIKEALTAIVEQSWRPFEVIICDDASTDDSLEIIREFADRYPFVRFVKNQTNLGVAASFNRLVDLVSGDYLFAASADDKILPDFFKKSMNLLAQYPQAGISSGFSFIIDGKGKKTGFITMPVVSFSKACFLSPEKVRQIFLKQGNWISGYSAVVRLDYLRLSGGYRPELYSFQDNFVYQVLALKFGACFIPEPIMYCRKLPGSHSMATSDNAEIFAKLIENATFLMQTPFSDIFPKEYVEAWRRENYFFLRYYNYKKMYQKKIKELYAMGKSMGLTRKLWVWWFRQFLFLKEVFFLCYLLFVFKQNVWKKCYNKIICFFIKRRYDSQRKIFIPEK